MTRLQPSLTLRLRLDHKDVISTYKELLAKGNHNMLCKLLMFSNIMNGP